MIEALFGCRTLWWLGVGYAFTDNVMGVGGNTKICQVYFSMKLNLAQQA